MSKSSKLNEVCNVDYHDVDNDQMSVTSNNIYHRRKTTIKTIIVILLVLKLGLILYISVEIEPWFDSLFKRPNETLPTRNETLRFESTIDELRYYIDNDDYLRSRNLTNEFLARFLVARGDNSRRTFNLIQNYFRMRHDHPELFMSATEAIAYGRPQIFHYQKERSPQDEAIVYIKMANWQYEWQDYAKAMATSVPFSEVIVLKGGNRRDALTLVDMSGWSIGHFFSTPPSGVQLIFELTERTLPFKPSKMHVFNQNWLSEQIFKVGQFFIERDKMVDITYHGSDLTAIQQLIPLSCLPQPLGGHVPLREWTRDELIDYDQMLIKYWTQFPA